MKEKRTLKAVIFSFLKRMVIEYHRAVDFVWAKTTGAPALYRSQIDKDLFLGGQYSARGLNNLKKWGITSVVSMRSRKPAVFNEVDWLKVMHLPTPDRHAPKFSDIKKGIAFIEEELKLGGKVYIHCMWGEGRGPTMAIAYLVSRGMVLDDALQQVRKVRTFIRPTRVQMEMLEKFETILNPNLA